MSQHENTQQSLLLQLTGHTNPHALLQDPQLNKGTAFSAEERALLGLQGLLPPGISTQQEQVERVMENFRKKGDPLEKYIFLTGLQERNETLFYRVLMTYLEEMLPIIYTPTVGLACQKYGHIFRRPQGAFISALDRGRIVNLLSNWQHDDIRVIVVTDGSRILGLGDLGANGMGIPVGKLSLYTACAGIPPRHCLPVTLDVGTNNEELLEDSLYIGLSHRRLGGLAYESLIDEFVDAVAEVFPRAMLQFEDFSNQNAARLLEKHRNRLCSFNDDIQGTASVALAGLFSALRITAGAPEEQRLLICGAGSAGIGIADLFVSALVDRGMDSAQARKQCAFTDSRGLVCQSRDNLSEAKQRYAVELPHSDDIATIVEQFKPSAIIGVSGQPNIFNQQVVELMSGINEQPIIFALSNPTSKAECTAEQAYTWSEGRAVFASGSPFDPVTLAGRTYHPGQGNNAYIFPGLGLGVLISGASSIPDEMFRVAAMALANLVSQEDLDNGCIYPPLNTIRSASLQIAVAVAEYAYDHALATLPRAPNLKEAIENFMCKAEYKNYVA
uniref:Malate dehydrogenase (Oxaloacetate-decarboxylating) (NADP(+)) n=1 Tax=Magnetococcus massalia (strain MO-1) TaxID=451514 RepID=A0A1S7LLW5_MAGMO|nr:Malate dehydrogenase (oxaloacetate-decarboxylating) (NADP(+)) [Candidatus Magnetococcus massalia]